MGELRGWIMATWLEVAGRGDYKLDHVDKDSKGEFFKLMQRAAQALQARDIPMWQDLLKPGAEKKLESRFEEGQVYLCYFKTRAVAGIAIADHFHRWGDEDESAALWVHAIVRDPDFEVPGLGLAILHWAEGKAKQKGKKYIRLEAPATSLKLIMYYEKNGYAEVGAQTYKDRNLVLMEKKIR